VPQRDAEEESSASSRRPEARRGDADCGARTLLGGTTSDPAEGGRARAGGEAELGLGGAPVTVPAFLRNRPAERGGRGVGVTPRMSSDASTSESPSRSVSTEARVVELGNGVEPRNGGEETDESVVLRPVPTELVILWSGYPSFRGYYARQVRYRPRVRDRRALGRQTKQRSGQRAFLDVLSPMHSLKQVLTAETGDERVADTAQQEGNT
jgi:hypothetical protein